MPDTGIFPVYKKKNILLFSFRPFYVCHVTNSSQHFGAALNRGYMFNSPVLDLVILLSFTYFIGSLILSAINEALAGTLRLRQTDLKKGIYRFFLSSSWRTFVKNTFFESPHIQTLMKAKDKFPAYIPARNFVLAIVEHLDANAYKDGNILVLNKDGSIATTGEGPEKKAINGNALPKDMITVLQTIMKQVGSVNIEERGKEFEAKLEEFYNLTMDRVTGWYKRRVRRILLALGLALAVILNIDTIKIANDAMKDKTRLAKAVDNISAKLPRIDSLDNKSYVVTDSAGMVVIKQTTKNLEGVVLTYNETTGYKLGYTDWNDFQKQWSANFLKKLLGVLLTAFALQLGSNYWFDLMNKAVNVRSTGRKPDEVRPDSKTTKS